MTTLQPDQRTEAWNAFVPAYERIFEPLTDIFASTIFDRLGSLDGLKLIDVACGPGGAALIAAGRGADVLATDASIAMIDRVRARAESGANLAARVMDAAELDVDEGSMDIAYSGFGVILLPDPSLALREIVRALKPGGRAVIVAWTEPHNYELATLLRDAAAGVRGVSLAPTDMPAQLRYTDPTAFTRLMTAADLVDPVVHRMEAVLHASSAASLAGSLAFAPGMAATLEAFGADRHAITARLARTLSEKFGDGQVELRAVAHAVIARKRAISATSST